MPNEDMQAYDQNVAAMSQKDPTVPKLIELAKDLLERLKSDGKSGDANKLLNAIQCTLDKFRAMGSLTGREMQWNIKGTQDALKSAEDKLVNMIKDLKKCNHYTD